ncbi:MAG: hypothetical protein FWE03_00900 [Firmicutes bacterium]|nr:hypothetical protein [Bacillota bacterium]
MYQVSLSAGAEYSSWLYALEKKLRNKLNESALIVTRNEPKRVYIAIACENQAKRKISKEIFESLLDVFASLSKQHYYLENLHLPLLCEEKYNILLAALIEFDSISDRSLIKESFVLENGLSIDGIYNFAFKKVKSRWQEIGDLTKENASFLSDNEIFFELIKYLFSAICPKIEKALCLFDGKKYLLYEPNNTCPIAEANNEEELFCTLIKTAPIYLELSGDIKKDTLIKLNTIFKNNEEESFNLKKRV